MNVFQWKSWMMLVCLCPTLVRILMKLLEIKGKCTPEFIFRHCNLCSWSKENCWRSQHKRFSYQSTGEILDEIISWNYQFHEFSLHRFWQVAEARAGLPNTPKVVFNCYSVQKKLKRLPRAWLVNYQWNYSDHRTIIKFDNVIHRWLFDYQTNWKGGQNLQ